MREEIQMKNALKVISGFDNNKPLSQHLKQFFRDHKNLGSKDRKILSALVFGFYRCKGGRNVVSTEEYITKGAAGNSLLEAFYNYWQQQLGITSAGTTDVGPGYFPLENKLTVRIDKKEFLESHLHQSKIWIRCRKNKMDDVVKELKTLSYSFEEVNSQTISFVQSYPLDRMKSFESGYFEIQDIASQHTAELFHPKKNEAWWDCCAGAGGKALMLLEEQPQLQLFVSDMRTSILHNLKERMHRNGFENYNTILADLTDPATFNRLPEFDCILADVPCSGSGTWGRTPEWLSYFNSERLAGYIQLQRTIISNVTVKLKPGGTLIYITCSVYADENENNVKWMKEHLPLQMETDRYLQFSEQGGDTMYGARLKKSA